MGEGRDHDKTPPRTIAYWVLVVFPVIAISLFGLLFILWVLAFSTDNYGRSRQREVGSVFNEFLMISNIGNAKDNRLYDWNNSDLFPPEYQNASIFLNDMFLSWREIDCNAPIKLQLLDHKKFDQTFTVMTAIWPETFYIVTSTSAPILQSILKVSNHDSSIGNDDDDENMSSKAFSNAETQIDLGKFKKRLRDLFPNGFRWKAVACDGFSYIKIRG